MQKILRTGKRPPPATGTLAGAGAAITKTSLSLISLIDPALIRYELIQLSSDTNPPRHTAGDHPALQRPRWQTGSSISRMRDQT